MFITSGHCNLLPTQWEFSAASRILGHMSAINNNVIKDMTVQVSERMTAWALQTITQRLHKASLPFKQTKSEILDYMRALDRFI